MDTTQPPSPIAVFLRILLSAGPDFWFAATFLITWFAPYTFGETTVHKLTYVMLMEFIVVHSTGGFAGLASKDLPRSQRAFIFTVLLAVYCLFAAAFAAGYGSPWPLVVFVILTLSKFPTVVLRPPDDDGQFRAMGGWAYMTALYLFTTFATVVPDVPPLGITPQVIERQAFSVEGLWPEQPYRPIAMGALYFTGLGLYALVVELLPLLRKPKPQ